MITATGSPARGPRAAFTLLEMLAVLLLMALLTSLVLPGLGAIRASALRSEARTLATQLEFTRQQAVVTGQVHRLLVEVDTGAYRVEWYAPEGEAADPFDEPTAPDLKGSASVSLVPPSAQEFAYRPISSRFGNNSWLGQAFHFEGIQTAEGWIEEGDVSVAFERDGSSDHVEIVIADDDGNEMTLEVEPLLEMVRIRDDR